MCVVIGHLKEKRGCLQDQLVKSSKAKVRILNPAAAAAATLAASAEGPGRGQGGTEERGAGGSSAVLRASAAHAARRAVPRAVAATRAAGHR